MSLVQMHHGTLWILISLIWHAEAQHYHTDEMLCARELGSHTHIYPLKNSDSAETKKQSAPLITGRELKVTGYRTYPHLALESRCTAISRKRQ